jgi:putative DNA primase/helicase
MKKKACTKPEVYPIGQGLDNRTGMRSWIFRVIDQDRKMSHVLIPFGSVKGHKTGLLDAIGRAGFPVPLQETDRDNLFQRLSAAPPNKSYRVVSTSGWTGSRFVIPRKVYASGSHHVISAIEQAADAQRFRRRGRLKDWQREVAGPLRGNHLAMFGLAVAFAGPLQRLLGVESGGFHLVGRSSIGKSTILAIAGSVWGGGGTNGFCNTWLSTSNALDDIATAHSDCFLALDETGVANVSVREGARLVLHAAYRLAGGEEKARKNDQRERQSWRLQFLGSTEHSLHQLGVHADEAVAAGQYVRIVDIEANAGRGLGVWDSLPETASSPEEFSDTLRAAAMRLYGTAADRYLKRLVAALQEDKAALIAWLKDRMSAFLRRVGASKLQVEQARIARRFALVYTAGALACRYDVLPWKREAVLRAAEACYRRVAWPEALLNRHTPERSIALVRNYIQRYLNDFLDLRQVTSKLTKSNIEGAPGIILETKNQGIEYAFSPSIFRNQVCNGADWERVWDHLSAADWLNQQKGGKRSVTRAFPKPAGRLRVISVKPTILNDAGKEGPDGN